MTYSQHNPMSELTVSISVDDHYIPTSRMSRTQSNSQLTIQNPDPVAKPPLENPSVVVGTYDYPDVDPGDWQGTYTSISKSVPAFPWYKRRVGRMYVLAETAKPDGSPRFLCVVGPCWPMLLITVFIIVGISSVAYSLCLPKIASPVVSVLAVAVLVFVLIALLLTGCTDPGIQKRYQEPQGDVWSWSDQAQSYRPQKAIFEMESRVLIDEIDHFCPWTGTVIAKRNMFYFNLFTRSLLLLLAVVLGVVIAGAVQWN